MEPTLLGFGVDGHYGARILSYFGKPTLLGFGVDGHYGARILSYFGKPTVLGFGVDGLVFGFHAYSFVHAY